MKLLQASNACLLVLFCSIYAITIVNCELNIEEHSPRSENSQQETARENYIDVNELLQLLQENFDQLTTEDEQVSGRQNSDVSDGGSQDEVQASGKQIPYFGNLPHDVDDSEKGDSHRLKRQVEKNGGNQSFGNSDSEQVRSTSDFSKDERTFRPGMNNHPLLNLSNILKNGLDNVEAMAVAPPQAVKKIVEFVTDRLLAKQKSKGDRTEQQQSNERFPSKLDHGKTVLGALKENIEAVSPVGIHRTLKVGPWSMNFDLGKP